MFTDSRRAGQMSFVLFNEFWIVNHSTVQVAKLDNK